jgi:hypothetical protein
MIKTITVWDDEPPTLKEAQQAVGGLVEVVNLSSGEQLIVDEEGVLKNKPLNEEASKLAGQPICGHALHLKGTALWT